MRIGVRQLSGVIGVVLVGAVTSHHVRGQNARPTIATEADFRRAMKELSNWGRWGELDELGAANLITPAKRKQALALAREGRAVSLAQDVPQEKAVDTPTFLDRALVTVAPNVSLDRYQYTGTYHGVIHSHLDAVDCHHGGREGLQRCVDGGSAAVVASRQYQRPERRVVMRAFCSTPRACPAAPLRKGLEPGTAIHRRT